MLLSSLAYKLKELIDHWDRSREQVRAGYGNTGLPGIGFSDLWRELANATYTPGLHLLLTQLVRTALAGYESCLGLGVMAPLRKVVEGAFASLGQRDLHDGEQVKRSCKEHHSWREAPLVDSGANMCVCLC